MTQTNAGSTVLPLQVFIPIHTVLEMITVVFALAACFTIASAPVENEVGRALVLAGALLTAAGLNFIHLMTMPTMPALIPEAFAPYSRVVALGSRSLICGALLALSLSPRFSTTITAQRATILSIYALAVVVSVTLIVEGRPSAVFSPLANVNIEWIFTATLGLAAFRFAQNSRGAETKFFPLMFAAAAILGIGHLLPGVDEHDFSVNRLARNVCSVVAYWYIYRAIFEIWVRLPFQRLTEQAKTLQQINSTMRFQALALESVPASIVLMDATGQVTWQNKASLTLQRQRDASTGAASPSHATALEITPQIQAVLAKSRIWRGGYQERDANGALRYFDKSITAVNNGAGQLEGYVSVADDITDTIKGELRYKRLLETAQDGFAITDIAGNYLEVNDAFATMVGYSREELLTMNAQALFVGSAVAEWLAKIGTDKVINHPRYNAVITRKNGDTVRVQSSVTFAAEEQQFFAFIHDNTPEDQANAIQRELENQLLHAQKVHALGELTSGIAHDFNNILASILGYSNLALDRFVPDKDSKLAKYINEVVSASERARDLIRKMLTFTRAQPNSKVSDIQPAVALTEVVAMLRPSIPSNIGITVRSGLPITVRIDSGELNQMLVNLMINARDAITAHGEIAIGWERMDATGRICAFSRKRLSGEYVAIFVSDSGSGIEAETLKRIFDPYFTTKDVGKGSGLGLSMVQGIMHRAGGHVLVDSPPGTGTTFRLLFPVTLAINPSQQQEPKEATIPNKGTGQVIWVIDDEAPICRYLNELLGEWGYEVQTFQDPLQAWAAFQTVPSRVDLVVTDQTMHGMTGTELIDQMRGLRPDLPVVICSGQVDELALAECKKIKVFRKPVNAHQFLCSVAELLTDETAVVERR
ncbi:MAG: PAS domain S-box protein [Sphingomonadaceae bacterium]